MTLTEFLGQAKLNLHEVTDSDFNQRVLAVVSTIVSFGIDGVKKDVERWLDWMLVGGTRPKVNKRSADAISTTQRILCEALNPYYEAIDWNDPAHFALIERATRPLPGVKPLGQPAASSDA